MVMSGQQLLTQRLKLKMSNNHAKLWVQRKINQAAIDRAKEAIHSTGKALPCRVISVSGPIVTVSFDVDSTPWTLPQITIPKAESNWRRDPTQVGDTGITIPADVQIGHISGLGSGLPKLTSHPGNLSALIFMPISNKNSPSPDNNAALLQGPNGTINRTTSGVTSSVVTDQNGTTVTYGSNVIKINSTEVFSNFGGNTMKLDSSGFSITVGPTTFSVNSSGVIINGIDFSTHVHGGVAPGIGVTSGPK